MRVTGRPTSACPKLLAELEIAHGDGRYPKPMRQLAKADVLVLEDWGMETGLGDRQRRDLLEIPGDPTLADAILDRLVHNARRIALKGKSKRKREYPALCNDGGTAAAGD